MKTNTYKRSLKTAKDLWAKSLENGRSPDAFEIADAITLAVQEEREACAMIANDCRYLSDGTPNPCNHCAGGPEIIRERE